jgi:hypothetical protein
VINAGWEVADHYMLAVEATSDLIRRHPLLGPVPRFSHQRLHGWRFIVVFRPFHKHLLFYEIVDNEVVLRRAMHGHRDLPGRLPS